ncbi:hypothetical protein WH52_12315 [Tenacibaculum holothuriorum]|uniref:DUF2188 domain-containing protein n=1 Tax=Tenacibaculum holothuriorum TaxID=1635173 RepID=A0A1Y2PAR0_9FLAO|nr:DUF2188 domain-containing protein [Tenacibaculum holothuriorum]OSY87240.1 hypothetical protein WH52_12315 [Tenacibaculum holothuriorum]
MVSERVNNRKENLSDKFREAGSSGEKLHVMHRRGQWVVFKERSEKVISQHTTRRSAILKGKKIIQLQDAEALVIHKTDGSVDRVQYAG